MKNYFTMGRPLPNEADVSGGYEHLEEVDSAVQELDTDGRSAPHKIGDIMPLEL